MVLCEACGKEVLEGKRFCTSFGAVITPPPIYSGTVVMEEQTEKNAGLVTWIKKIPLITNPYLVLQCIFIQFGIAIVMGRFFSLITGREWALLTRFLILGAGLSVLMLIIMTVQSADAKVEFHIGEDDRFINILKATYGEKVHMPFG